MARTPPRRRKTATEPAPRTVKASIQIDGELHARWCAGAALRGMTRGDFAALALTEALKGLVLFDRGKTPGPVGRDDDADAA